MNLTENDVLRAISSHLEHDGFEIRQRLGTRERGIDLVATRKEDGQEVLVEAKGATSSKGESARYGQPFKASQVRNHTANALLAALKLRERRTSSQRIVIALPATSLHEQHIRCIDASLAELKIEVLWVESDLSVREH